MKRGRFFSSLAFLRCMVSAVICLAMFLNASTVSKAVVSTNVPDITWTNDSAMSSVPVKMRVPLSDCVKSGGYYTYDTFLECDFEFTYYADKVVSPFSTTNLCYEFMLYPPSSSSFSVLSSSESYSLVIAGTEYTCSTSGWINLVSVYPANTYITFKVHFSGMVRLTTGSFTSAYADFNTSFSRQCYFKVWNCYQNTDLVYDNNQMLQQLVNGNAGIEGAIREGNQLQAESNQLQKEANETRKNIFQKISDFFAGFFEGIINAVKSLFIPDDEYFADYFSRLNDFFADKLGMLYAPIDMFIKVLDGFLNASAADSGIPFPGVKWGDTWFIEPQTVSLTGILSDFPGLQDKIYFATDVVMVGAVLLLLQNKLKGVLNR